jgi:signal transduction histidine kinase
MPEPSFDRKQLSGYGAAMNGVTILWAMVASACLTLAVIHALVWWRERQAWSNLFFSLTAAGTAGLGVCEYWMMQSTTISGFGTALRWLHVPGWVLILSLVGFVQTFLRSGRPWLAWTVGSVRTLSLVLDFVQSPNLNFREITQLRPVTFLGETVVIAEGVPNPWMLVGQASLLLLIVFVVDATITAWRRGDRRRALVVGGSIILFVIAGSIQSVLVLWSLIDVPLTPSLFFLGLVMAMGHELSRDVLNAGRLARELAHQRVELARVNRVSTMGELAASLAHELNQPLTGILSNAQAGELLLDRRPPDTAELREVLAAVIADTRRASDIIRHMRNFLCKRDTPRESLDLNTVIDQVLRLLRSEAVLQEVVIQAELASALPPVLGDRGQLHQVFLNLILNAQQAMATLESSARRLVIRTRQEEAGRLQVTIDDSGPGFDPARLDEVFDPFYTTRTEGMGMGLAICRSIVESHAGHIHAANRPEGGARVTITLPSIDALRPPANRDSVSAPNANPGAVPR